MALTAAIATPCPRACLKVRKCHDGAWNTLSRKRYSRTGVKRPFPSCRAQRRAGSNLEVRDRAWCESVTEPKRNLRNSFRFHEP